MMMKKCALKDSIESQLYEVREQDLLIAMKIPSSHINPLEQLIMDTSKLSDVSVNVNLTFYQVQILRELAIEEKRALFEEKEENLKMTTLQN